MRRAIRIHEEEDAPVENQISGEFDSEVKLVRSCGSVVEVRLIAGKKRSWSEVGKVKK